MNNSNKLFIIGNGFDLAHGIESTYEHFKKYLEKNCQDEISDVEGAIESGQDISENSGVMFGLLFHAINEIEGEGLWSNLEKTLGDINYDGFLSRNGYKNNDILLDTLKTRAFIFKDYFYSWVNKISIERANSKEDFKKLINSDDLFLNFNYTKTLEDVYNVNEDAVVHIHGVAGDDVEFGHGADHRNSGFEEEELIHEEFRKDTDKIVEDHEFFFGELIPGRQIKEIYSFGFSYGDVDQVYLTKLIKSLGKTEDITWFFNRYDKEREKDFMGILKTCGFNGNYDDYEVIS
ncbi:TPA: bacteriophage abortive infection AbiH family protein [Bacillus tropicus]